MYTVLCKYHASGAHSHSPASLSWCSAFDQASRGGSDQRALTFGMSKFATANIRIPRCLSFYVDRSTIYSIEVLGPSVRSS